MLNSLYVYWEASISRPNQVPPPSWLASTLLLGFIIDTAVSCFCLRIWFPTVFCAFLVRVGNHLQILLPFIHEIDLFAPRVQICCHFLAFQSSDTALWNISLLINFPGGCVCSVIKTSRLLFSNFGLSCLVSLSRNLNSLSPRQFLRLSRQGFYRNNLFLLRFLNFYFLFQF